MTPDNELEMGKQTTIKINPEILRWLIESSGWKIDDLAKRLDTKPDTILHWYAEPKIEINKLEKLAEHLKRPLGVFFLPEPPFEPILTDYRRIGGLQTEKLSRKTLSAIRQSRYQQSVAKNLMESQGIEPTPKINKVRLDDDPEQIATVERERLGFYSDDGLLSREVKDAREFYNKLRANIESLNIYVFQINMPIKEARGFTLSDDYPLAIIVNSADEMKPRIFTLLHEYGHILIKKEGICLPQSNLGINNNKNELQRIERWCNIFAASVLMPRSEFLEKINELEEREYEPKKTLELLSGKFKASKTAIVIRMKDLTPNKNYLKYYEDALNQIKEELPKPKKKGGGGGNQINNCIGQKGRKFISLILDSQAKQLVDYNELIDYLDINIKNLRKLQETL